MRTFVLIICGIIFTNGQNNIENQEVVVRNGLTERIGNFSVELLYHTAKEMPADQNLILAPLTAWTVLAVIAEGATENTLIQINRALRIIQKNRLLIRSDFINIAKWLNVNTSTVDLQRLGILFVDRNKLPYKDFQEISNNFYFTQTQPLDFSQGKESANRINSAISNFTHGRIKNLVEPSLFNEAQMFLTSAVYFRGQWTVPFNTSDTRKMPFYDTHRQKIGEVNMMYNRHNYPFANIKELQARVIEIPYGVENRLSMIIMLPDPGVSLENMFINFQRLPLDTFFSELKHAREEFGDDEIDCFLPRFKIESSLDLTEIFKKNFGIEDLFDQHKARLGDLARLPLYVTKIIHKAEIEVTEEGTIASGVTLAEFSNRIGSLRFEVNRPFSYMIVEKVTNSIVFGGMYKHPTLY